MNRWEGGVATSSALPQLSPSTWLHLPRYSILPHSDLERCFSIEPEDGTIRTAVPLDREARVWHNLTVLATELGEESWAPGGPGGSGSLPAEGPSLGMGRGVCECHTPPPRVSLLGAQPGPLPPGRFPGLPGWTRHSGSA